jgi:O-antigen ligase
LILTQGGNFFEGLRRQSIGRKYLYFYGMMIVGIPFAYYRRNAFEFVIFQYSINMLYFCLFFIHVHSYERMKTFAFTIVCSIFFYGLVSLQGGISRGGRYTFGKMYDPNDLAYLLVSLLPFTGLFFQEGGKLTAKLLAAVTAAISLILIVYTGSRGGLIGLVVLLFLFLFTNISPVKRSIKIASFIIIIIFTVSYAGKIFTERNSTLLNLGEDYNATDEYGRVALWKKGVEFTLKNPLTGVGATCFPEAIGIDRKQRMVQESWQVVHNAYLQISSEIGLVAFIIFFLMLIESFRIFQTARRMKDDQAGMTSVNMLAGILQLGFISHLVVAAFLAQGYSIIFTLFFAFAAVIDKMQGHFKGV